MARTRGYKRAENNIVRSITAFFKKIGKFIISAVLKFFNAGRKKLTIMVVPHSQKEVINFQTSLFSLIFAAFLFIGIIGSFFWFSHQAVVSSRYLASLKEETKKTQASLDLLRSETDNLLKSAKNFQSTLSSTFTTLGLNTFIQKNKTESDANDLSKLFTIQEQAQGAIRESAELQQMAAYLQDAIQPVQEMGKLLNSQTTLFSDIPSLWPIKGGIGHVSMGFGQNKHPFTGQWYVHKGIDLSTYRYGDPIIATADGQVVTVEYDSGWGNYVIVKHKHGFYTRYAHMQSYNVTRGQHVQQGQVIGYIGATGVATGPHLHYEVHIGSDVVDPRKYLNIKAGMER